MSELSPRVAWPFPSRDTDPWFDAFVDLIRAQDATAFAHREDRNLILSGGGLLTWSAAGGLTWDAAFQIFSPSTGFFTRLVPATLVPADGEVIRAEIVRAPGLNRNVNAEVAGIAQNTNDSLILGMRVGTSFYFRNGAVIKDGESMDAEDLFGGGSGGPDNFSYKTIPSGDTVTIPANQQMIVKGGVNISGTLNVLGELTLI